MKRLLLGCLLTLGLVSSASAAPLAFDGTFSIAVGNLPIATGTGAGVGDFGGAGGTASIPAGVFSIAMTAPINPPLLVIDGFGIGAPGQGGPNQLPLSPGTNKALAFGGVTGTMGLDMSGYLIQSYASGAGTSPNNLAAIPLAIVGVGTCCKLPTFGVGLIMGTIKANPYQLGMVTVMGSLNGSPSTVMGTGFDNRTAGGAGVLQLVTPTVVALGALGSLASIATLTLHIVPEPATALFVALGVAALGALRARNRSHAS
jgi:hypothetical protein